MLVVGRSAYQQSDYFLYSQETSYHLFHDLQLGVQAVSIAKFTGDTIGLDNRG